MVRHHGKRTALVHEEKKKKERESARLEWMGLVFMHQSAREKRGRDWGHMHQVHSPFIFDFK
jgi:hypothetical protein